MPPLAGLPPACGLESCGTVQIERRCGSSDFDQYGSPIPTVEHHAAELLAPSGAQFLRSVVDTDDVNRVVRWWRFWLIPPADITEGDRLLWDGCCFEVQSVRPSPVKCCCGQRLHHLTVEACEVDG